MPEFYTALDWSGSPGDPRKVPGRDQRLLVFVAAHLPSAAEGELLDVLVAVKHRLQLPPAHVFKHVKTTDRTRDVFFSAMSRVTIEFHANVIDRSGWAPEYFTQRRGPEQIIDGIVQLIASCDDRLIEGQVLMIDLPRSELGFVREIRQSLRDALRSQARKSFAAVRPCPDHRGYGALIQVADMVAGELRSGHGTVGPHLRPLFERISFVADDKTPPLAG